MENISRHLGLGDFLGYICPGAILLVSVGAWEIVGISMFVPGWEGILQSDLILGVSGSILAYAIGLILESINQTNYANALGRSSL